MFLSSFHFYCFCLFKITKRKTKERREHLKKWLILCCCFFFSFLWLLSLGSSFVLSPFSSWNDLQKKELEVSRKQAILDWRMVCLSYMARRGYFGDRLKRSLSLDIVSTKRDLSDDFSEISTKRSFKVAISMQNCLFGRICDEKEGNSWQSVESEKWGKLNSEGGTVRLELGLVAVKVMNLAVKRQNATAEAVGAKKKSNLM